MTTEQYIALSALVYSDLSKVEIGSKSSNIGSLIDNKAVRGYRNDRGDINSQFSALSSLSNYTLIAYQPNTANGFKGAAFQAPDNPDGTKGEIVFAFRGTEPNTWQDIMADLQLASIGTPAVGPNQFYDAEQFVSSVLASNVNSGYMLTGRSLGGGVAQYMKKVFGGIENRTLLAYI